MKFNLLYSPSQRRGIFFLLVIFIYYFVFLFFERNSKENISPIVVVDSEIIETLELEKTIVIPQNINPNCWKRNDWNQLGFSSSQIQIIENYQKQLNIFTTKKQLLKCYAFNEKERKMIDSIVVIPKKETKLDIKKTF